MKKWLIMSCACTMILTWTGFGIAKEGSDHVCFRRIDADRDGKVTMKEFAVHYSHDEKKFKAADRDGNGLLTHDEYHEFLGHGLAEK